MVDQSVAYYTGGEKELDELVSHIKVKIRRCHEQDNVSFLDYSYNKIIFEIRDLLANALPTFQQEFIPQISPLSKHIGVEGDFSFGCFEVAKYLKQPPAEVAILIKQRIESEIHGCRYIRSVSYVGPYVNFSINVHEVFAHLCSVFHATGTMYGSSDAENGKTIIIDYSSPNIAKPMGVGHLRSTNIGGSLANIHTFSGACVVRVNHLGDWGSQFCKIILAKQLWEPSVSITDLKMDDLLRLYVRFSNDGTLVPDVEKQIQNIEQKLEAGDEEYMAMWSAICQKSIQEIGKIYEPLHAKFDLYLGESYFRDKTENIIQAALSKGVAKKGENGALVVDVLDLPTLIIQKSGGSALYITRDLAALRYRMDNFSPQSILYVVGSEQSLHFKQLFSLAHVLGIVPAGMCSHIAFGLVNVGGKKMSTRGGTLIKLDELIAQMREAFEKYLVEKHGESMPADNRKRLALQLGVGSLLFRDLSQNIEESIQFDWERMLAVQAGNASYIFYTLARAQSVLKKMNPKDAVVSDGNKILFSSVERRLVFELLMFPEIVRRAASTNQPKHITEYLTSLAAIYSGFYNDHPILSENNDLSRSARIRLTEMTRVVIRNGLSLLNIEPVETRI